MYAGWSTVLLFLYCLNFLQVCIIFVIKMFFKNEAVVWRVVWRGANLVQVRNNRAQTKPLAIRW